MTVNLEPPNEVHHSIDASLSAGLYVNVAAILEEAAQPRELIRVNEVNFTKLTSTTHSPMYGYIQETDTNQKQRL